MYGGLSFIKAVHVRNLKENGTEKVELKHYLTSENVTIDMSFDTNFEFDLDQVHVVQDFNLLIADHINYYAFTKDPEIQPTYFYFVTLKKDTVKRPPFYLGDVIVVNVTYNEKELDDSENDEDLKDFIKSFTEYVSEYFK